MRTRQNCFLLFLFLLKCHIGQALQNLSDICIDADGLPLDPLGANRLPLVDAGIGGVRVFGSHLPEGILDDDRGIVANAQFQKEDFLPFTGTEKILIPRTEKGLGGDQPEGADGQPALDGSRWYHYPHCLS